MALPSMLDRFEFDVGPEGDPVPSDIKIVFRQRVAKRVTVSMEVSPATCRVYPVRSGSEPSCL